MVKYLYIYFTIQGELEHRSVKRYYSRTNKIHPTRQIARIHRRERVLQKALDQHFQRRAIRAETNAAKSLHSEHHYISSSRNIPLRLSSWLCSKSQDRRFNVCMVLSSDENLLILADVELAPKPAKSLGYTSS